MENGELEMARDRNFEFTKVWRKLEERAKTFNNTPSLPPPASSSPLLYLKSKSTTDQSAFSMTDERREMRKSERDVKLLVVRSWPFVVRI